MVALVGCSNQTDLTPEEQAAFKGGGKEAGPRDEKSMKGIADFRAQFEAKHGKSGPHSIQQTDSKI